MQPDAAPPRLQRLRYNNVMEKQQIEPKRVPVEDDAPTSLEEFFETHSYDVEPIVDPNDGPENHDDDDD